MRQVGPLTLGERFARTASEAALMPDRLIVAYPLIAVIVAGVAAGAMRLRYMSPKNVRKRERNRRRYEAPE